MKLQILSFAFLMVLPVVAATTTDAADKDLTTADLTINVDANDTLTWTGALVGGRTQLLLR